MIYLPKKQQSELKGVYASNVSEFTYEAILRTPC